MVSNQICFNQVFFLVTLVIVILFFIYFVVTNRNAQLQLSERFTQVDTPPDNYIASSPPLIVNAKDVPQLYRVQNILPYNKESVYDVANYPNVVLNPFVVGCGGRREPCYGGSQQVVSNILPPLDVSNKNIAPNNINLYDSANTGLSEVGSLYKIFGNENLEYPLLVKVDNNPQKSNRYFYFTKLKNENVLRKVVTKSPYRELGINDQVKVDGEPYFYRVTVYQSNYPSYPNVA
jgi:hypothetical protein